MPLDAKVLVVDDDVVTRACLVDYFAAEGYDEFHSLFDTTGTTEENAS